jgi:eukaryotic-like serine/threonine-protein kinase
VPELQPGSVLHGTYTLVDILGRGGMGIVWKASHTRLPRPFAIKVLNDAAYESREVLQRFRREAEVTSQLGHPNIIQVFDFNVLEDGRAYLVMEFLDGVSLRDRMRQGAFSEQEAVAIVRQVASALGRVHKEGIVHRDLKPENIFLCRTDDGSILVKVLDFGISKVQGSMTVVTQDAALLGTPRYMSPEQARGENTKIDGSTDQFALAAIAYEMLTGRPAFSGDSVPAVLHQVSNVDPAPMDSLKPSLPSRMASAIHRALSKVREQRFEDMTAFLQAFDSEAPTVPDGAPAPPGRRGPALVAAAVALGLLVALGAFAVILRTPAASVGEVEALEEAKPTALAGGAGSATEAAPRQGTTEAEDQGNAAGPSKDGESTAAPEAGGGDASSKSSRPERPERRRPVRLSAEAQRLQAVVSSGDYRKALAVGQAQLRDGAPPDVYIFMTAAYCGLKDLAGAKSMWRAVPRRLRPRTARECRELGLQVDG